MIPKGGNRLSEKIMLQKRRNVPMRRVHGMSRKFHSPLRPIARHREREQEVNFMVETG
jgi:hypothetical protein